MRPSVHVSRLRCEEICKWEPDIVHNVYNYIGIITPYQPDFVEELKQNFPSRNWIASQRLWIVATSVAKPLVSLLAKYFFGSLCVPCLGNGLTFSPRPHNCDVWAARFAMLVPWKEPDIVPIESEEADRLVALFREFGRKL